MLLLEFPIYSPQHMRYYCESRAFDREAMGIVHSKVLGGGSQGSGRSILDVGKGAYRYVLFFCVHVNIKLLD